MVLENKKFIIITFSKIFAMQPDWFIVVCWRLLNNFGDTPTASVYLNFVCVYIYI